MRQEAELQVMCRNDRVDALQVHTTNSGACCGLGGHGRNGSAGAAHGSGCSNKDPLANSAAQGPALSAPPATTIALAPEAAHPAGPLPVPGLPVAMTVDTLRGKAPTFWALLFDLPWEVVPFALGMFVLVEGLYVQVGVRSDVPYGARTEANAFP